MSVSNLHKCLICLICVFLSTKGNSNDLSDCPSNGNISYELGKIQGTATVDKQRIKMRISKVMDEAISLYNCYTNLKKHIKVGFDTSVKTALGSSFIPRIRFGDIKYVNKITALHEIAHVIGVGSSIYWSELVRKGVYVGEKGIEKLREIKGNNNVQLYADKSHFWPYGMNYISEVKSEHDLIAHCQIVEAINDDLIELSKRRESWLKDYFHKEN